MILQAYKRKGVRSIVLDPLYDPAWYADFQTDDREEFLNAMYHSRSCALFVDESGSSVGRYSGPMAVTATQSRHLGHRAHFITQRPSQLDKTIRDQCGTLFLFCVSKKDAETLADEFGYDEIMRSCKFRQGECVRIERFKPPVFMNIFNENKRGNDAPSPPVENNNEISEENQEVAEQENNP